MLQTLIKLHVNKQMIVANGYLERRAKKVNVLNIHAKHMKIMLVNASISLVGIGNNITYVGLFPRNAWPSKLRHFKRTVVIFIPCNSIDGIQLALHALNVTQRHTECIEKRYLKIMELQLF